MKMDVSKFKKVSSDEKQTILKHPRGHQIVIDHRALSPAMRKQLHGIPHEEQHFAEGGEAQDESIATKIGKGLGKAESWALEKLAAPWVNTANTLSSGLHDLSSGFMSQVAPEAQAAPAPAAAPEANAGPQPASIAPQTPMAPAAPANPDPYGYGAYERSMQGALASGLKGIRDEAAAQGDLGKQQAAAEAEQQQFVQQVNNDYKKHYADLQAEYQNVLHDVQNQHINPNHYMESMSAGKKVATAIGLILGGMGAGLTGQENMAQKFLHQQINNDIEAQRMNLGKSESLLSANLKQFGNLHDATQMTMAMQNGIYASKLRQAAAVAQDPILKARALQAAMPLEQQAAQLKQQVAMRKAVMGGVNSAGDPAQKIRFGSMAGIIPKGEEEHLYKELGEAQSMSKARDNVLSAIQAVAKRNTVGNRIAHPFSSQSEIDAIWDPMVAALSKETAGRFTEQDAHFLNALKPSLSDGDKQIAEKTRRADALMQQKMHFPRLDAYGINPYQGQRFGAGGQKNIQLGPAVRK